uniref:G-patch domain-containing protein n=1 Tax=Chromera velia CCMP2878 TaxID=1169474 RepID=A0A0G4ICG1_9ALVE|mmetsp:Transcript_36020/g.70873  ORF Transcript_36020/g.70873 Transcript_36020/m.70873 type:complete len:438 (+) Transcript_36020:170-1483(+)|eukprot:Cvel_13104.t1-p1 / transcript=Cvel_13104.t1 / gene=Cvel_13104 / organism=Chromera_velia_CCMP2878 / gene_product=DNA-damage-repair/toleration protein DRT111,, putative / transcript_product=DNA-damage-repair/toleration protein DRT111,, putative / location=Cvel_scaffold883:14836-16146(-) / protein_length=437 / sequence_SO=supercontig / SO=protein_coding / is_pseudo=false
MLHSLYSNLPPPSTGGETSVDVKRETSADTAGPASSAPKEHTKKEDAWTAARTAAALLPPPTSVMSKRAEPKKLSHNPYMPQIGASAHAALMIRKEKALSKDLKSNRKPTSGDVSPLPSPTAEEDSLLMAESDNAANLAGNLMRKLHSEYDPMRPNEYEIVIRERVRRRQQEENERRQQEELERFRREREEARANAPPSSALDVSGEEAWKRRAMLSGAASPPAPSGVPAVATPGSGLGFSDAPSPPSASTGPGAGSMDVDPKKPFASRYMEKMGWQAGQGLGRERQGMTAPLVARKTDKRSGVIVQGQDRFVGPGAAANAEASKRPRSVQFNRPPTRVVLLLNMVGKEEVDEELKEEVQEEGIKFGNLLSVKIHVAAAVSDDRAVRIFLEYESKDMAIKALMAFEGRFFGGRSVKARFFSDERYAQNILEPGADEE